MEVCFHFLITWSEDFCKTSLTSPSCLAAKSCRSQSNHHVMAYQYQSITYGPSDSSCLSSCRISEIWMVNALPLHKKQLGIFKFKVGTFIYFSVREMGWMSSENEQEWIFIVYQPLRWHWSNKIQSSKSVAWNQIYHILTCHWLKWYLWW